MLIYNPIISYGYEINGTLLQLATAFSMIANNGYPVTPTLILNQSPNKNTKKEPLYDADTITKIREILHNTVMRGTAKRAQVKGYNVMSKTGTANLLVNGKYSEKHNIYTCAGIIEKDDYQRVIVTFIKEVPNKRVYASTVAAPLFERIAEKTLIHDKIL